MKPQRLTAAFLALLMFASVLSLGPLASEANAQIDPSACGTTARANGDLRPTHHASCIGATATSASWYFKPSANTFGVNNGGWITGDITYRLDSLGTAPKWNGDVELNQPLTIDTLNTDSLIPYGQTESISIDQQYALDYIVTNYGHPGDPVETLDGTPLFGQFGSHSVQIAIYRLMNSPVDEDPVLAPLVNDPGAVALWSEANERWARTAFIRSSHLDRDRVNRDIAITPVLHGGQTRQPLAGHPVTMSIVSSPSNTLGSTIVQNTSVTNANGEFSVTAHAPTTAPTSALLYTLNFESVWPNNQFLEMWDASDSGTSTTTSDHSASQMSRIIQRSSDTSVASVNYAIGWDPRHRVSGRVFDDNSEVLISAVGVGSANADLRFSWWNWSDLAASSISVFRNQPRDVVTFAEVEPLDAILTSMNAQTRADYMWDNFSNTNAANLTDELYVRRVLRHLLCLPNGEHTTALIDNELANLAAVGGDRARYTYNRSLNTRTQDCRMPFYNIRLESNTGTNGTVDLFNEFNGLWAVEVTAISAPFEMPLDPIRTAFNGLGEFTAHFDAPLRSQLLVRNINGNDGTPVDGTPFEIVTSTGTYQSSGISANTGQRVVEPYSDVVIRFNGTDPDYDNHTTTRTFTIDDGSSDWDVMNSWPSVSANQFTATGSAETGGLASGGQAIEFGSFQSDVLGANREANWAVNLWSYSDSSLDPSTLLDLDTKSGTVTALGEVNHDLESFNPAEAVGVFEAETNLGTDHVWYNFDDNIAIQWDRTEFGNTYTQTATVPLGLSPFRVVHSATPSLSLDMLTGETVSHHESSNQEAALQWVLSRVSTLDSATISADLRGPYASPSEYETADPDKIIGTFTGGPTVFSTIAGGFQGTFDSALDENGFYFWHYYDGTVDQLDDGFAPPAPDDFDVAAGLATSGTAGTTTNLALAGTASQSSNLSTSVAANAIDGNTSGNSTSDTAFTSNSQPDPWWEVDLGSSQDIGLIRLWNRDDFNNYLFFFSVFISDSPFDPAATHDELLNDPNVWSFVFPDIASQTLPTNIPANTTGRYVRIQRDTSSPSFLSLAEVEVFEQPADVVDYSYDFHYERLMTVSAVAVPTTEPGTVLPGVGLEAVSVNGGFATVVANGTTDANGIFEFDVPVGVQYCVRQTSVPVGFSVSATNRCTSDALGSTLGDPNPQILSPVIGEGGLPLTGVPSLTHPAVIVFLTALGAVLVIWGLLLPKPFRRRRNLV